MWLSCGNLQGTGRIYATGGSGSVDGGGGSGGRVLVQCDSVTFKDENIGVHGNSISYAFQYPLYMFIGLNNEQ